VSAVTEQLVNYKFVRPGARRVTAEGRATHAFVAGFGTEYSRYVEDPRELYMGPTPGRATTVGAQVRARMAREGRYRPDKGGEVAYRRDLRAQPLPPGQVRWVSVTNCDMGHVIDAVVWWNSNGRLTGPQSPEVLAFMKDPDNYEFEPSAENRLRGALRGARYLPPVL
jgi:HNH/ENDO VII superfamily nuclease with conserved GHE residues